MGTDAIKTRIDAMTLQSDQVLISQNQASEAFFSAVRTKNDCRQELYKLAMLYFDAHDLYAKWTDLLLAKKYIYQAEEKGLVDANKINEDELSRLKQEHNNLHEQKLLCFASVQNLQSKHSILNQIKNRIERLMRNQMKERSKQQLLQAAIEEKNMILEQSMRSKRNKVHIISKHRVALFSSYVVHY